MSELYTLPDGWEWKKLGDICDSVQGIQLVKKEQISELKNGYIRYLYISDFSSDKNIIYVQDKYPNKIVNENEYVIVNTGATAGRIFNGKKGVLSNNLFKITNFRNIIDKYFYFYYLNLYQNIIINELKQSTQPHLGHKAFNGYNIPLPPLEEQKRIVTKLDNLFAKIDKAIALHQKNIDEANIFMASVLNDVFVELEEKYGLNILSEVVKINSGIALPSIFKDKESMNGEYEFFKVAQMNNDKRVMKGADLNFTLNQSKEFKIKLFPKGSILIPKRGGAILTNKKRIMERDASYDSNIMGLKADNKILSDEFLFVYLDSINLCDFVDTSTIPQINNKHIDMMNISLPPLKTQQKVVSYLDEISQKMEKIKQIQKEKMQSLKALKASILDQAFKGEL